MFPHRWFALRMFTCRYFPPAPQPPAAPVAVRFTISCGGPIELA
jgi:hypothetical protein